MSTTTVRPPVPRRGPTRTTRAMPPWRFELDALILEGSDATSWSWRYVTDAGAILATGVSYRDRWDVISAAARVVGVPAGVIAGTITTGGCIPRAGHRRGVAVTMIDPNTPLLTHHRSDRG